MALPARQYFSPRRPGSCSLIDQVPGFGVWKLFNLVKPLLGMFLPGLFGPRQPSAPGAEPVQEQTESKKQAKLRARAEKGDKRIQQVQRR